jgi:hypothetical protein
MDMTRREWLAVAGALPFAGGAVAAGAPGAPRPAQAPVALPDKAAFAPMGVTYLDSGSQHPISRGAKAAVEAYLDSRTFGEGLPRFELDSQGAIARFARLVNATRTS